MRNTMGLSRTLRPVLLVGASAIAAGQSTTMIVPDQVRVESNTPVEAYVVLQNEGAEDVEHRSWGWGRWNREWLFVRGAGTQSNLAELPRRTPEPKGSSRRSGPPHTQEYLRLRPAASDTWLVGLDLTPRVETVTTTEWSRFAKTHLPDLELEPTERESTSIRRHESAKSLIVVRDAEGRSGSSGTAMGKTGQRMEIRPLADPCTTTPGSDLPMRLYVPLGLPKSLRATATHLSSKERVSMTFGADGQGSLVVPSAGTWVVEVHGVERAPKDAKHDWDLYTTTLVFEAPPVPPAEKDSEGEDD